MALQTYHVHMTQRKSSDPYWQFNCGAYSGAMLIEDATLGGLSGITGRVVRSLSSEPVPDPASPGLNIPQVLNVMRKLHVEATDMSGHTWSEMMTALNEQRRVTLSIDYGELPAASKCQAKGDFGHQIVLIDRQVRNGVEMVHGSDPLCSGVRFYIGDELKAAAQAFARQTNLTTGLRWAMTRSIPKVER